MQIESFFDCVEESAEWIRKKISNSPSAAVVLSGGLEQFLNSVTEQNVISYKDIPNFPAPRAEGHAGRLVFGKFQGQPVAVMQGRFHYYEGHPPHVIIFPYFVLEKLGVRFLITTNAVGGIRRDMKPGDIMVVNDHINLMGMNPLIGIAIQKKSDQFTNMTRAYDPELRELAHKVAREMKLDLKEGVYLATSGPNYETKAEIGAFRQLGADAVGMSTVPSVIAANFLKMRVLTLSCIANPAADLHPGEMNHKEVLAAMSALAPKAVDLIRGVLGNILEKKV